MGIRRSAIVTVLLLVWLLVGSALANDAGPPATADQPPPPPPPQDLPATQDETAEQAAPDLAPSDTAPPAEEPTGAEEPADAVGTEPVDANASAGSAKPDAENAAAATATTSPDGGEPTAAREEPTASTLDRLLNSEGARTALEALLGLLVFLLVWPLARVLAAGAYWLTAKGLRDPKLTALLGIELTSSAYKSVAQVASRVVFLLTMAAGLIAGIHISGLTAVSEPLDRFASAASYGLPLVVRALVILAISYVAARLLRTGVTRGLQQLEVDERLRNLSRRSGRADTSPAIAVPTPPADASLTSPTTPAPVTRSFSEQVGVVTYWLVLAFGLAATVESLEFVPLSRPLRDSLDRVIGLLPALCAAALILAGGYLLARLTRKVVTSLLEASGFDRLVRRIDIGRTLERIHPSAMVGFAAMVFVLAEAAIAALNQLGLVGMSAPLTAAVTQVGAALPYLGLAILIMAIGHFVGRFARTWTEGTASDLRIDALLERLGILKPHTSEDPRPPTAGRVLGLVAYWVVLLLAAQQAFEATELTVWAAYVSATLGFGFQKLAVAGLIILAGLAVANQARTQLLARQLGGAEASTWIAAVARVFVLVFAFTMAIQHVGVADRFVTITFAFAFGGLCLALALAFGLGSREIVADVLKKRLGRKDE
jgi:hypothetical protein